MAKDWAFLDSLKDDVSDLFPETDTDAKLYTGNVMQDTGGRMYYMDGEEERLKNNLRRYAAETSPKKDVPLTPMGFEQAIGLKDLPAASPAEGFSTIAKNMSMPGDQLDSEEGSTATSLTQQIKTKSPLAAVAPALTETTKATKEFIDEDEEMRSAQQRANDNLLLANLLRASNTIGGALGTPGKDVDQSTADMLAKQASRPVEELKDTRAQLDKKIERESALESLKNTKEFTDPNSAISQLYREEAKRIGVQIPLEATAKQIHQILPMIESRIKHEELLSTKREIAAKEAEAKKERKEIREDEKKDVFTQGMRREMTAGKLGELFQSYAAGERGIGVLENAIKDPSGYKDFASVFATLKATQGDASVIREAEMRLGLTLGSLPEKLHGNVVKLFTGEMLAPSQRKKMLDSLRMLTEQNKRAYLTAVKPVVVQAKRLGIPTEELTGVPLEDSGEIKKDYLQTAATSMDQKTEGMVKRLMDNNPGLTKEAAVEALKKKGYIK